MSKSIKLSKEHGVNPTIPICFWCEKDKNEVVMLGKLKNDAEAPKRMWIPGDYEPCDECKKQWENGIVLFEAYKTPVIYEDQPPFHGGYPNGRWTVLTEEGVKKIFYPDVANKLIEQKMGFMDYETIMRIHEIFEALNKEDDE